MRASASGVGGAGGSQVEQQGLGLAAAEIGQENVVTAHVYPTEQRKVQLAVHALPQLTILSR
jgi:hypothetical protein